MNTTALHVDASTDGIPPGEIGTDLNKTVVKFLNKTLRLISAEDRPSKAVGIKLRKLFVSIRNHCVKMKVDQGLLLFAMATYNYFQVWWLQFLEAENMPQFRRLIRGVIFGARGFKGNKQVHIFETRLYPLISNN